VRLAVLPLLSCRVLLGSGDGIKEPKELLDPRDFQRRAHAIAHADQRQPPVRVLPRYVCPDERSDTSRVGIRHVDEVDDQNLRLVRPHGGLKLEHRRQNQRAGKSQNPVATLGARLISNLENISRHARKY